ncbi:M15 family metallopeptidase [Methylocystis bryophila]|nr:M15 family metallopeptidase [Methylocystis bryophila]BDV39290.1 hypothetical protein DSM21852_25430 [Methylocystis bryophila]
MVGRILRLVNNAAALACCIAALSAAVAMAQQVVSGDALVRAYPDYLKTSDEKQIVWNDGTRMPLSDGKPDKSFDEKLKNASLLDQLSLPYPIGKPDHVPGADEDPGRFRNQAFFDKMYGDCDKHETQKRLVKVPWFGGFVEVTTINGVADKLRAVAAEIDRLPAALKRYAYPSAGAFACRTVKDTGKRSMHAYGAALDINTKYSDYWLWGKGAYHNRIPWEIVEIFERHGFIWGGKWGHFDTMHFEYRPEYFDARQ